MSDARDRAVELLAEYKMGSVECGQVVDAILEAAREDRAEQEGARRKTIYCHLEEDGECHCAICDAALWKSAIEAARYRCSYGGDRLGVNAIDEEMAKRGLVRRLDPAEKAVESGDDELCDGDNHVPSKIGPGCVCGHFSGTKLFNPPSVGEEWKDAKVTVFCTGCDRWREAMTRILNHRTEVGSPGVWFVSVTRVHSELNRCGLELQPDTELPATGPVKP